MVTCEVDQSGSEKRTANGAPRAGRGRELPRQHIKDTGQTNIKREEWKHPVTTKGNVQLTLPGSKERVGSGVKNVGIKMWE